jgi:hypothetical protein
MAAPHAMATVWPWTVAVTLVAWAWVVRYGTKRGLQDRRSAQAGAEPFDEFGTRISGSC